MKKSEIVVGGIYLAKVSGKLTTVRVDEIERGEDRLCVQGARKHLDQYHVTNLTTGRKTTFRSAAKFRGKAGETLLQIAQRERQKEIEERLARAASATIAHDDR